MRRAILALAAAVLAAPLIWRLTDTATQADGAFIEPGAVETPTARLELLETGGHWLRPRVAALEAAGRSRDVAPPPGAAVPEGSTFGGFGDPMLLASRDEINQGLTPLRIDGLVAAFGAPAPALSDQ